MNNYNLKFRLFNSSSGILYLIEEQSDQKTTNHYAYHLSDQFKEIYLQREANIKNCKHLRKHLKEISIQNKRHIVFEYQEGQTLEQQIINLRGKSEWINIEQIGGYLAQMLETLFQLHSHFFLGRVFSTKNIMDCKGQLLFLDFGYGPQLTNENLDLCAPPELIQNLAQKNSEQYYSTKIDSWLLGAVLYHLVKLTPVNAIQIDNERVKIMNPENIGEYLAYLKKKMEESDYIETNTSRFSKEFCSFIEGLLTYDVDRRLSFYQIYHHQFIKSLNLPNYNQYLAFYEQFDENNLIQQIYNESKILRTNTFQVATASSNNQTYQSNQTNQQFPLLRITSNIDGNLSSIAFPRTSSRAEENFQGGEDFNIEKHFPFEILDRFNDSKFYQIFQYVRMEQFKFIYLEKTADEIIFELSKKRFQLEYVCAYFFRKMAYLILVELLKKLNEDVCPWKCDCADRWKDFQKEKQKDLLVMNLKKKMADSEKVLKQLFNEKCQNFIKDERIEKCVREQLEKDQIFLEKQKIDGFPIYIQYSEEFLKSGYRQLIYTTYKFLDREKLMAQKPDIKYNSLQLKILLCHLINRIFDLNQVSIFLQSFLENGRKFITSNELYSYICKDDENRKEKEIQQILNEYFKIQ